MKILVRTAQPTDHAFIFATYLRNRWFAKDNKTTLKRSTWSALMHKRIEKELEGALIACLDEDPDTILGYLLPEEPTHFVYVKKAFRSEGLAVEQTLNRFIRRNNG